MSSSPRSSLRLEGYRRSDAEEVIQRPPRLNTSSIVVIVFQLRVVARSPNSVSIAPR